MGADCKAVEAATCISACLHCNCICMVVEVLSSVVRVLECALSVARALTIMPVFKHNKTIDIKSTKMNYSYNKRNAR